MPKFDPKIPFDQTTTNTSSATNPIPASPKYDEPLSYLGEVADRPVGVENPAKPQ